MKLCPACRNSYPDDYQTCPRDQAVLTSATGEIVVGTILRGKYEVLGELGAGGMATVYKVRHKAFQELAAVKVVHPHFMHDPDFVKRFRNEAIVARQLKHPNAVRIDDFDYTEDGRPFIVMEYVEGHSLYDVRKQYGGAWPMERCMNIAMQATSALAAAHALGIVHRDIKPSNILLLRGTGGEGQVKLLDFGIAKVADKSFAGMTSVMTSQDLIIGTPEYMSPEQARGRADGEIDGRADLYSLGLVLYEMITGSHPFQADTPMAMLMQQLHTPPPPPDSFEVEVSPAISALVLKSLEKDASNRFQSAAEMLAAMKNPDAWYADPENFAAEWADVAPVALPAPPPTAATVPARPPKAPTMLVSAAVPKPIAAATEAASRPVKTPKPPTVLNSPAIPPLPPVPERTNAAVPRTPKKPTMLNTAPIPPPPTGQASYFEDVATASPATYAAPPAPVPVQTVAQAAPPPAPVQQYAPVAYAQAPPQQAAKSGKLGLILAAVAVLVVLAGIAFVFLRKPAEPAAAVTPSPVSAPVVTQPPPTTPVVQTPTPTPTVDPDTQAKVTALIGKGNRALARGDADMAAEFFGQALSDDPGNAEAAAGLRKAKAGKP